MRRGRISAFATAILVVVAAGTVAEGQELSSTDKYYIGKFDNTYKTLDSIRKDQARYRESQIRGYLKNMAYNLEKISDAGRKSAEFKERKKQLEEYTKLVDKTFSAKAKEEGGAGGLTSRDKHFLKEFDRIWKQLQEKDWPIWD